MQRLFLFTLLAAIPWLVITGFNIGLYAGNAVGQLTSNGLYEETTVNQEPAVWAFHTETVWQITGVWAGAIIAVWIARKLLNTILGAIRPSES